MKEPSDFGQSQAGFLDSSQGRHTNPDNMASNGQNSKDPQPKLHPNHQICHSEPAGEALRSQDAFLAGRRLSFKQPWYHRLKVKPALFSNATDSPHSLTEAHARPRSLAPAHPAPAVGSWKE